MFRLIHVALLLLFLLIKVQANQKEKKKQKNIRGFISIFFFFFYLTQVLFIWLHQKSKFHYIYLLYGYVKCKRMQACLRLWAVIVCKFCSDLKEEEEIPPVWGLKATFDFVLSRSVHLSFRTVSWAAFLFKIVWIISYVILLFSVPFDSNAKE